MARVYEAEQISLNRRVALKVLPAHLSFSDDAVQKFRREAEAGGRRWVAPSDSSWPSSFPD